MPVFGAILLVAAVLVAVALLGIGVHLIAYLVSGLIIGALARLVLPGKEKIGLLGTALVGMGGSVIGGIVGSLLHAGWAIQMVLAVAAAAVLLSVLGFRAKR